MHLHLRKLGLLLVLGLLLANCAKWKVNPYDLIPQVLTGAANTPATTSVQVQAQVGELGPNTLQEFGIVYSTTNQQPTIADTKIPATGTSGNAAVMLNNLKPNTTYYYRTYATNNKNLTGYGETKSFKTADAIPDAQTLDVVSTTATSAQVQVQVNNVSTVPLKEYGIVYSATNQQPTVDAPNLKAVASGTDGSKVTLTLSGLAANTTYYYRAYGLSSAGSPGYGTVKTIKTNEPDPIVATLDPVGTPTSVSAVLQCQVTNAGSVTLKEIGICYSRKTEIPTVADETIRDTVRFTGPHSFTILNLGSATRYTYRGFAINTNGKVSYGDVKSFTATEAVPVVETLDPVGTPASTSAQVQCQVTNVSVISLKEYGIVYSATNAQPTTSDGVAKATGTGGITPVSLSGLLPGTTYNYRAYAINGAGAIGYGALKTVTTASANASPLTLYVPSTDGTLYAVDPNTGAVAWKFPTGGPINSNPVVANGRLYLGSNDGNLYALDPAKGTKLWSFSAGASFATSSPVVDNNVVYIGNENGKLYAINATTGAQIWAFATQQKIWSSPAIANGIVYVGSYDSYLYAIDATTGAKKWAYLTKGVVRSCPLVTNGVVYIGSQDKNIYAFDAQSGSLKWSFPTGGFVDSSPTVANGVLYVGSRDKNLYALDAISGAKKWAYLTGDEVYSSPMVASSIGVVYVGSDDHKLHAINIDTGAKKWTFEGGSFMSPGPIYANGLIYAGNYDFKVYALDPFNGSLKTSFNFVSNAAIQGVSVMAVNGEVSGIYPTNSGAVK